MAHKHTVASLRIKQEMKEKSLTARELAKLAKISYYTVDNILAGKSSKIDKIEAISKALGKPLMYFINADYDNAASVNISKSYDGELHYKVIKAINEVCVKNKIFLTREKMDEFVDAIYPKIDKRDPEGLILAQSEAIINYTTSKQIKTAHK